MKTRRIYVAFAVALLSAAAGCASISTEMSKEQREAPLIHPDSAQRGMGPENPPTYLKPATETSTLQTRRVSINTPGKSLAEVLQDAIPDLRVHVQDGNVDLTRNVKMFVRDATLGDFLDFLSAHTGYDYTLDGDRLRVSSIAFRQWNVAAFSSARKAKSEVGNGGANGGGGQSGASASGAPPQAGGGSSTNHRASQLTVTQDEDEWQNLITSANAIIDHAAQQFAKEGVDPKRPATITAMRSLGIIQATGEPLVVRRLDKFMSTVVTESVRQVNLSVTIHEVTLNDSKGHGINWHLLTDQASASGGTTLGADILATMGTNVTAAGPGLLSVGLRALTNSDGDSLQVLLNFLGQYGKVNMVSQPNVTVTNGHTASINNGLQFRVVASVDTTVSTDGVVRSQPIFEQVLVGVEMATTVRLLDDNSVLIDVIPIVSSLQGIDEFNFNQSTFRQPRIALQELATQVVAHSGQTVHLGGLVLDRISETINRIPRENSEESGLLDWIFKSETRELSRKELVISITPRIVKS